MSEGKPGTTSNPKGRDRWGLRPVRNGRVRGQIRNVRSSREVSEYGDLLVFDFDLFVGDDEPLIPVRMRGTDFQNEPREGNLVEMPDPSPDTRPIQPTRLDFPPHYGIEVVSYYPGRDDIPQARQRMNGLAIIVGPIAATLAAIGVYFAIYG